MSSQDSFQPTMPPALDPPPLIVWLAGIGIAAIVWSFARLFVPIPRAGRPPVGEP